MNGLSDYMSSLDLSSLDQPLPVFQAQEPVVEISEEQAARLNQIYSQAIQQDLSMPRTARPLSEAEAQFLRCHTVVEIGGRAESSQNPFERFVANVVKQAVMQMAGDLAKEIVQDALHPPAQVHRESKPAKKDPSVETMKKIAKHDVQARTISMGKELLKESINVVQHGEFINYAGQALGASLAGTKFLEKVAEEGFDSAVAHTAGTITTDFILKHGVNAATAFVGCTNPLFCAKLIITVVKDLFTPTETAPPSIDMYGHIPPMQFPQGSHLPPLNPNLGPAFRAPQ
ncbi:MAG: hypothetical protein JSR37_01050 [Verrucomicrobia bacterium]|nr:hypothetical protein [Verrucomicrobiota bacterium]MBS0636760.1 hypothetical protein [Verrucomicrobiota bacterium]